MTNLVQLRDNQIKQTFNLSPLAVAIIYQDLGAVQHLISQGENINGTDWPFYTPLMLAIAIDAAGILPNSELKIALGNAYDAFFSIYAQNPQIDQKQTTAIIELLVQEGVDLDARHLNDPRLTPLMVALKVNSEHIQLLLNAGAEVTEAHKSCAKNHFVKAVHQVENYFAIQDKIKTSVMKILSQNIKAFNGEESIFKVAIIHDIKKYLIEQEGLRSLNEVLIQELSHQLDILLANIRIHPLNQTYLNAYHGLQWAVVKYQIFNDQKLTEKLELQRKKLAEEIKKAENFNKDEFK